MDTPISGNGITIYLVEELSDARLRCEQLKRYVRDALDLVGKSPNKDRIYEVAGHLLQGIPDVLFKLDKALSATAMATSKLDYEKMKQSLRPEKAQELENVLEDSRMQLLKRRGYTDEVKVIDPTEWWIQKPFRGKKCQIDLKTPSVWGKTNVSENVSTKIAVIENLERAPVILEKTMTPERVVQAIRRIALEIESTGNMPIGRIGTLVRNLDRSSPVACLGGVGFTVAASVTPVAVRHYASKIASENTPSRKEVVATFENVMANTVGKTALQILETASSRDEVMKGFKGENPALTQEQLEEIADHWEENKDNLKTASEQTATEAKESRFEEGKPADPTENMSKEDAKEWKANTEENKDNFKTAAKPSSAEIAECKKLGKEAFEKELPAIPAMDPALGKFLKEHAGPVGSSIPYLKAWQDSYIKAALAAPLQEKTASQETSAEKESRFEEGKPADPTENMSKEDAAKWKKYHGKVDKLAWKVA